MWKKHSIQPHIAGVDFVLWVPNYILLAHFELDFKMSFYSTHRRVILHTTPRNLRCLSAAEVSGYYGNGSLKYEYFISSVKVIIKRYYRCGAKRQYTVLKRNNDINSKQYYSDGKLFRSIVNSDIYSGMWWLEEFHRCGMPKRPGRVTWCDIDLIRPN